MVAALLLGVPHDRDALLSAVLDMEGHPDNIVAALWGGFTLGVMDGGNPVVERIEPPAGLRAVLLIPEVPSSTVESRAALPAVTSRGDAVFNASRVGLMVYAMAQDRRDVLRVAMADRLHHPYRGQAFRYLLPCIEAAIQAGAHGASLSGAGSAVIALASDRFEQIEAALARVAEEFGVMAQTYTIALDTEGARYTLDVPPG
jgi:homoserine kinase